MGSQSTNSNVALQPICRDSKRMKRTIQVNVKMTEEDMALLKRAANKRWPDAVLTNSGIVLGFAKLAATQVLDKKGTNRG